MSALTQGLKHFVVRLKLLFWKTPRNLYKQLCNLKNQEITQETSTAELHEILSSIIHPIGIETLYSAIFGQVLSNIGALI